MICRIDITSINELSINARRKIHSGVEAINPKPILSLDLGPHSMRIMRKRVRHNDPHYTTHVRAHESHETPSGEGVK